ncbi:serine/threonine-protein kinase [Hyalangium rubrum]|uniref:Serine/threonine-protein kinase n=1 Tax=Hyalangium rubrum TaxID=3103134 RepID=A0ABU5GUQ1_9BACT|nr:serine/threonine-protein kinase [Hyalangium sp. s54d21]MDY7224913.1 serine/threonine-protein kinase [Hyalangium sp. s54d21]
MVFSPIRPDELTPGTLVGNWRILQQLGRWGHGAIYRVEDVRNPGHPLALKMSLRESEGHFDEWTARLKASHPNVVRLHACGRWPRSREGFFFVVRDYIRGQALPGWAEKVNPTFLQVVALMSRLAFAIDHIHGGDTWHRDIRPDNIRVRDEDGEPVLLDLRAGGNEGADTLTQMPLPPETLVFRSPEALRFLRVNWGRRGLRYYFRPSDDLYALGATAYWLVTGHSPFSPSLSLDQLHREAELRMPPAPWEINPRVPRGLGTVILRLLSKIPDERPRSGGALSAELMATMSAGNRMVWASRAFAWEQSEGGQASRRILVPEPPRFYSVDGPRLPQVVHFNPPANRAAQLTTPSPRRARPPRHLDESQELMGPWSRMM